MTDNEIIKALECCKCDDCDNCPNDFGNCYANLAGYALDLINRQKAEIERLEDKLETVKRIAIDTIPLVEEDIATAKAEAIKEFAERLKEMVGEMVDIMFDDNESKCRIKGCRYPSNIPCGNEICLEENKAFWNAKIDTLVKEMVGDTQ